MLSIFLLDTSADTRMWTHAPLTSPPILEFDALNHSAMTPCYNFRKLTVNQQLRHLVHTSDTIVRTHTYSPSSDRKTAGKTNPPSAATKLLAPLDPTGFVPNPTSSPWVPVSSARYQRRVGSLRAEAWHGMVADMDSFAVVLVGGTLKNGISTQIDMWD